MKVRADHPVRSVGQDVWTVAALVMVVAIGAGLRLAEVERLGFAGDEAWTLHWSTKSLPWIMRHFEVGLTMHAYILFVKYWREVVGESALALKLPSIIAGVVTLPVLFACTRRWVDTPVALVTALLAAFDYRLIEFSSVARVYAMLVLWAIGSMFVAFRLESRGTAWGFFFLGLLNALGIALSLNAAYVVAAQGSWLLGEGLPSRGLERRRLFVGLCVSSFVTAVAALAFYSLTLPAIVAWTAKYSGSERPITTTLTTAIRWLHPTEAGPLLAVSLLGAWRLTKTPSGRMVVFWGLLPPLLCLVSNPRFPATAIARYLLVILPAHLVFLATGWVTMASWVTRRRPALLASGLALLSVLWGWSYVQPRTLDRLLAGGAPHSLAIRKLQKIASPEAIVLTTVAHERWIFDGRVRARVRSVRDQIERPVDLGDRPLFVVTPRSPRAEPIWRQAFWLHPIEDAGWGSQYAVLEAKRQAATANREALAVLIEGMIEQELERPPRVPFRHHRRMEVLLREAAALTADGDPATAARYRSEAERQARLARRARRQAE